MGFEQATIKVEQEKEFGELKGAIERVFRPEQVEKFLKRVEKEGIRVRQWDKVIAQSVIERVDDKFGKSTTARKLYEALPVSDQAQMREFYLSKLEAVSQELRTKYKKIYQYY
jgi:cobalamin biosynthesis protein CbiD